RQVDRADCSAQEPDLDQPTFTAQHGEVGGEVRLSDKVEHDVNAPRECAHEVVLVAHQHPGRAQLTTEIDLFRCRHRGGHRGTQSHRDLDGHRSNPAGASVNEHPFASSEPTPHHQI